MRAFYCKYITQLADNYILPQFDTLRVLNFLTSFSDVRFEALLTNNMPAAKRDSIIHSPFLTQNYPH
jgi:hypothetical protein